VIDGDGVSEDVESQCKAGEISLERNVAAPKLVGHYFETPLSLLMAN
jgi:hypothetical protein